MKEFLLSVTIGAVVLIISGIIMAVLWGLVVPYLFPGLVASGAIAGKISIWTGIGLSILANSLFGSAVRVNKGN